MDWLTLLGYLVLTAAAIAAIVTALHAVWHVHGRWKIWRAGPRRLMATRHRIWRGPTPAELTDLRYGPGGPDCVPVPPFHFIEEHLSGSQPCIAVRDARHRRWRVKWGYEARPEAIAVRVAWALGYFAEVTHFVPGGVVKGAPSLSRARGSLAPDGTFTEARFELEDRAVRMLFDEHSWAWDDNPFVGTPQLAGLKIVNMLLSNWDTKDRRDVARGSNTAIFEHRVSPFKCEARYLITDWGGAMGRWGSNIVSRGRWDADGFAAQTPQFVTGVVDGWVTFGYTGQRTAEIARGISIEDGRWFYGHARRLTERALFDALVVCGATDDEAVAFAQALVERIRQIGAACDAAAAVDSEPSDPTRSRRTMKAG
jgi:hypothetical protein